MKFTVLFCLVFVLLGCQKKADSVAETDPISGKPLIHAEVLSAGVLRVSDGVFINEPLGVEIKIPDEYKLKTYLEQKAEWEAQKETLLNTKEEEELMLQEYASNQVLYLQTKSSLTPPVSDLAILAVDAYDPTSEDVPGTAKELAEAIFVGVTQGAAREIGNMRFEAESTSVNKIHLNDKTFWEFRGKKISPNIVTLQTNLFTESNGKLIWFRLSSDSQRELEKLLKLVETAKIDT